MDDFFARLRQSWEALIPQEEAAFGFPLRRCPQCEGPLQEGWVAAERPPLHFHPGDWADPPSYLDSRFASVRLGNKLRWGALMRLRHGDWLAARRCPTCRLVLLKYED